MAEIHHRLRADCIYLGRFTLCHLLLTNDSNYPWFILVPDLTISSKCTNSVTLIAVS